MKFDRKPGSAPWQRPHQPDQQPSQDKMTGKAGCRQRRHVPEVDGIS